MWTKVGRINPNSKRTLLLTPDLNYILVGENKNLTLLINRETSTWNFVNKSTQINWNKVTKIYQ